MYQHIETTETPQRRIRDPNYPLAGNLDYHLDHHGIGLSYQASSNQLDGHAPARSVLIPAGLARRSPAITSTNLPDAARSHCTQRGSGSGHPTFPTIAGSVPTAVLVPRGRPMLISLPAMPWGCRLADRGQPGVSV
jgi:hypothetical protein